MISFDAFTTFLDNPMFLSCLNVTMF